MWLLYIPPHRKCVSTLPCEICTKVKCHVFIWTTVYKSKTLSHKFHSVRNRSPVVVVPVPVVVDWVVEVDVEVEVVTFSQVLLIRYCVTFGRLYVFSGSRSSGSTWAQHVRSLLLKSMATQLGVTTQYCWQACTEPYWMPSCRPLIEFWLSNAAHCMQPDVQPINKSVKK